MAPENQQKALLTRAEVHARDLSFRCDRALEVDAAVRENHRNHHHLIVKLVYRQRSL